MREEEGGTDPGSVEEIHVTIRQCASVSARRSSVISRGTELKGTRIKDASLLEKVENA